MALAPSTVTLSAADDLLRATLAVSLTAINLLRPVPGAGGEIIDFVVEYLNPAAQRIVNLPEQPAGTLRALFPHVVTNGLLDFYRRVYTTGEASKYDFTHHTDGHDGFYLVAAQRSGQLLVVSLTDSSAYEPATVEQALRTSQAREQAARLAVEHERNLLDTVLQQAPVAIGLFQGPEQRVAAANEQLCAMWGYAPAQVLGKPLLEGVPELRGQGFTEQIAAVARTGVPFVGREAAAQLPQNGRLETAYFNFVYQPLYDSRGELLGVLDIATDVTEQVLARQQVQHLNEELAATNEELLAANWELLASNAELAHTQAQLQQLNQQLEDRVLARTQALLEARADAEQQRRRLERFFMQAPAAICIFDGPDFVFELVNPAYQKLFPGRLLLGQPLLAALPELADQPVWHTLGQVYTTGQTHEELDIHLAVAKHEGGPLEDFYFHYIQQARYDEQGRIDGVLVFALDVTTQVLAQQRAETLQAQLLAAAQRQVQERETFYRVFEHTPAVIGLLRGPEHRVSYYNAAYQLLLGGRPMRGRTVIDMQPEAETQGFIALLDHVYATGETYFGVEVPLEVAPLGPEPAKTVYLNFTYQAYREDNRIVGISVFATDVTEQVLARQQRAAAQAQLQAVLEQAPVAIAIVQGPNYLIEVANPLIASIWGRTQAQLLGQPLFDALPEAREQGFPEILAKVMQEGQPFLAQEVSALLERHGQLDTVYLNFVYQPLRDEAGCIDSVAIVATEVSEQVAARQQIAHANQQLRAINTEFDEANQQLVRTNVDLDNFIYTASHDLKAPITNIEGLLTALREQLPPAVRRAEQVAPLLAMMQGSVERFQKTIAQLADISKLQQAHAQPPELVDLATLVEDIRLDLLPELAHGATLTLDVAACPTVAFSAKNLRSIIYNLLSNGLKYRAPERAPVVQLRCHRTRHAVVLEVQDNGLGLDEGQQSQLFQMFQRLHSHVEGSGVGLYMVKKIVENAGGTITVQSQPGVGSTFTVVLPDQDAAKA
ncbi:PAS domain-containing sensor histidine kinase [Hymenobacter cheonanensis]|uniref:PAS domain-containing sensor histidine kinase n=1 Tax=Hymenobacter sp. CA2-7 TaxID=3063993 RepID=UPI0027143BE2|nr:PAS domain-containing protein [Hymenobacter sp. CA2-7]MDO7887150.1 PAS domain-containing protein [Hymenobacter sp. CA2-7]